MPRDILSCQGVRGVRDLTIIPLIGVNFGFGGLGFIFYCSLNSVSGLRGKKGGRVTILYNILTFGPGQGNGWARGLVLVVGLG